MEDFHDMFSEKFLSELDRFADVSFIIEHYPSGKILYTSKSMSNIFGYEDGYFLGNGLDLFISITHPEDGAKLAAETARMVKMIFQPDFDLDKMYMLSAEGRQRHQKGHWIWTEVNMIILNYTPEKEPNLILVSHKDISARKAAEEFLWQQLLEREPSEEKRKALWEEYERIMDVSKDNFIKETISDVTLRMNPIRILSDREKEILKLISKGLSSKEIADELQISFHTAEKHRKNILQKFEVKNTAELIKEASRSYWLGN